ncbi:MAG TPA: endospore germination permease [Bacillales bacterium]|nr:endospore germination permease [Bacillales bacterium]
MTFARKGKNRKEGAAITSRNKKSQINQEPKDPSTKFVITTRESSALIISTIIGAGVLTLPRSAAEISHQSAWLSTLCGGVVIFFVMWAITKLGLRFPGKTFVEYTGDLIGIKRSETVGKLVSLPILLFFILMWLAMMVAVVRMFGETIVSAVLPETPLEVVVGIFLLAVWALLIVELEVIVRFNEILLPVIIIPVTFVSILSLQNAELTNIFPMFKIDLFTFLKGVLSQMFAYQGFTIMLIFMAFVQRGKNVRASAVGVALPAFNYILIVFATVAVFGFEELQHLTWPTLELMKSTDFSFFVLERIESAFVAIWVVAVYTTAGNLFYAVCFALAQILPTKKEDTARKWIAFCLLPVTFWLVFIPANVYQLFRWTNYLSYIGLIAFAIPVVLLILAVIRKQGKGGARRHEKRQKDSSSS